MGNPRPAAHFRTSDLAEIEPTNELPGSYNCVTLPRFVHSCGLSDAFDHTGGANAGVASHGHKGAPPAPF